MHGQNHIKFEKWSVTLSNFTILGCVLRFSQVGAFVAFFIVCSKHKLKGLGSLPLA